MIGRFLMLGTFFRKSLFPGGLAKEPPETGLASGLFCLSERVSFLKEGFSFDCSFRVKGAISNFTQLPSKTLFSYCNIFLSSKVGIWQLIWIILAASHETQSMQSVCDCLNISYDFPSDLFESLYFPVPRPRGPCSQFRGATSSNLQQDLCSMVEYEVAAGLEFKKKTFSIFGTKSGRIPKVFLFLSFPCFGWLWSSLMCSVL